MLFQLPGTPSYHACHSSTINGAAGVDINYGVIPYGWPFDCPHLRMWLIVTSIFHGWWTSWPWTTVQKFCNRDSCLSPITSGSQLYGQSSSLPLYLTHIGLITYYASHRPFTITLNGVWGQNKKHPIIWHICIKSFGAYLPSLKLSQRCLGYQWRHDDIGSIQVTTLTILSDRNVEYKICFPWGTDAIFHWDWKHGMLWVPTGERQGWVIRIASPSSVSIRFGQLITPCIWAIIMNYKMSGLGRIRLGQ